MKYRLWAPLVLLVLASLACSLGGGAGGGEEATPAPGEEGGVVETPATGGEGATTEAEPGLEVDADALSGLSSYRARWEMRWTPEGGSPEIWTIEQEETREPDAKRIVMTTFTADAGEQVMEMVEIGDTSWLCSGGECIQTQQTEEEAAAAFGEGMSFKPEDFTAGADYRYVGHDTVNGMSTRHYVLTVTPASAAILAQGEVSDVQADVWVADEAGLPAFVARFAISWHETRDDQSGVSEWSYEIYDVNAPITIEPPEGAAGMPEDIPAYPGATGLTIMGEMISFTSTDSVATVAEFYRTQLPGMGWALDSDDTLGDMVNQSWSKDGRTLNLMISTQDSGSSVLLMLGES